MLESVSFALRNGAKVENKIRLQILENLLVNLPPTVSCFNVPQLSLALSHSPSAQPTHTVKQLNSLAFHPELHDAISKVDALIANNPNLQDISVAIKLVNDRPVHMAQELALMKNLAPHLSAREPDALRLDVKNRHFYKSRA